MTWMERCWRCTAQPSPGGIPSTPYAGTLMAEMEQTEAPGERLELVNKLDTILSKLQAHEKILLSFADKLGMTPEARVRLARRRAAQAVQLDPDGDLFGD